MTASLTPSRALIARLHALSSQLSPAARRVVDVIELNPEEAAQLTAQELAAQAATSPSSVVRVARTLGYPGYPQLRLALAALPPEPDAQDGVLGADVTMTDDAAAIVGKLAQFEAQQLQETADLLDERALEAVAVLCAQARRISVYGVGASGLVATDLAGKLARVGLFAQVHIAIDSALPDAALLRGGDVAIGISHSGESAGAVRPLRTAADHGAHAVALTGRARSPLAQIADHVLLTAGREFGFRSAAMASRTGQLLAGDAIFVRVAQLVPDAHEHLRRTYQSLK